MPDELETGALGLQRIQVMDQLLEPAGASTVEIEDQPRQVLQGRFVKLFL